LKKITDEVASYHHFAGTAIRYFGMSGGLRQKFVGDVPFTHNGSNCTSNCIAVIVDGLLAVS